MPKYIRDYQGRGKEMLLLNEFRNSAWHKGNILEIDGCNSCTFWIRLCHWIVHLKMFRMEFYIIYIYFFHNENFFKNPVSGGRIGPCGVISWPLAYSSGSNISVLKGFAGGFIHTQTASSPEFLESYEMPCEIEKCWGNFPGPGVARVAHHRAGGLARVPSIFIPPICI